MISGFRAQDNSFAPLGDPNFGRIGEFPQFPQAIWVFAPAVCQRCRHLRARLQAAGPPVGLSHIANSRRLDSPPGNFRNFRNFRKRYANSK
jgi:hypothetical protein